MFHSKLSKQYENCFAKSVLEFDLKLYLSFETIRKLYSNVLFAFVTYLKLYLCVRFEVVVDLKLYFCLKLKLCLIFRRVCIFCNPSRPDIFNFGMIYCKSSLTFDSFLSVDHVHVTMKS